MKNKYPEMTWFVLGPSGVGKSSFGQYLADTKNWLHIELDQFDKNGIDKFDLRKEWNILYNSGDSAALIKELTKRAGEKEKRRCVLTFHGNVILPKTLIENVTDKIKVIYFYGSAARCIAAFLRREQETGRKLELDHWVIHNCATYIQMSSPDFEANRVYVFTQGGERRSHDEVYNEVINRYQSS